MNSASAEKSRLNRGFEKLRRELIHSGRFERTRGFHLTLFLVALGSFALSYGLALTVDSWIAMGLSLVAATASAVQLAYVAHDAGHGHIARRASVNRLVGEVALTAVSGYAFSSWVRSHSEHHAHPNFVGRDPDVESDFVSLHGWALPRNPVTRLSVRLQHWFIMPYYTLHLFTLRLQGARDVIVRRLPRDGFWVLVHLAALVALPALTVPLDRVLGCYVAVTMASGLYYGPTFLVNHVGTQVFGPGEQAPFVSAQVRSSRNIVIGRLGDLVLGGLNFQIEHHLFPDLPRFRLRGSSAKVRAFCEGHGLPYEAVGLPKAAALVFQRLRTLSGNAALATPAEASVEHRS